MPTIPWTPFLRRVLFADAAMSGFSAIVLIFGAGLLSGLLGLPATLLLVAGILLVPFSAGVAFVASRSDAALPAIWAILLANAGWALASIALLFTGWIAPTALGVSFIIAQAIVVAAFAEMQFISVRRRPAIAV